MDGEGRVCAVYNSFSGIYTGYVYDAEGNRVLAGRVNGLNCNPATDGFSAQRQYLLDERGEVVTELDGGGNWKHSNAWTGGQLEATYDGLGMHFQLADPLGTRRVQTNVYGVVENSFQSLPFGDALAANPTSVATADDATEEHFTGKQRDTESGLDYFGARYYGSSTGRWTSPDWSDKVEPVPYSILDNPQSLNLYAYVGNNPLVRTDPTGHYTCNSNTASRVFLVRSRHPLLAPVTSFSSTSCSCRPTHRTTRCARRSSSLR